MRLLRKMTIMASIRKEGRHRGILQCESESVGEGLLSADKSEPRPMPTASSARKTIRAILQRKKGKASTLAKVVSGLRQI
jgi:hypothetical protein